MNLQPYLFFNGRCEEAVEFYRGALGAEVVVLLRHGDSPEPPPPGMLPPGAEKKIMHGALRIGESTILVSDGRCTGEPAAFSGIALALHAGDDAEVGRLFGALEQGGSVQQPLTPTFFATRFGVVTDRFGVQWMVLHQREEG